MRSPADLSDWARSGAMALTGRPEGPPLAAPGRPASIAREQLEDLGLSIPGLLGERAAYAGLSRRGPWSCGGATRVLPTRDGHVALSLARPADVALLPALIEAAEVAEPWPAVAAWAAGSTAAEVEERLTLLGLPGGAVRDGPPARPPVLATRHGTSAPRERPLVVDLTSLWAGPLCAHLLRRRGARVITVESVSRPDGAKAGTPDFHALLHRGHERVCLDLRTGDGVERLRELIATADLVLEASRPRALRQLGIDAEQVVAAGTSWLSITARGRESQAVGFGDDIAARAGMVRAEGAELLPVGDALADPLAGVRAAWEASRALAGQAALLIDLSMVDLVAETLAPLPEHTVHRRPDGWWVEHAGGLDPVSAPERRR